MEISLEFSGIARIVTGQRQATLALDSKTTFRELIRMLAEKYPSLVGEVIKPDGETLYPSNMLNLNGKRMVQLAQMDESPQHGDRVILMSVLAGG